VLHGADLAFDFCLRTNAPIDATDEPVDRVLPDALSNQTEPHFIFVTGRDPAKLFAGHSRRSLGSQGARIALTSQLPELSKFR